MRFPLACESANLARESGVLQRRLNDGKFTSFFKCNTNDLRIKMSVLGYSIVFPQNPT